MKREGDRMCAGWEIERVDSGAHNRIVTCMSGSCFHNYGLLKIRIGATVR